MTLLNAQTRARIAADKIDSFIAAAATQESKYAVEVSFDSDIDPRFHPSIRIRFVDPMGNHLMSLYVWPNASPASVFNKAVLPLLKSI